MIQDRKLIVQDLGLIAYEVAWNYQKKLVSSRKENRALDDVLVLAEHPPVYTLGTAAKTEFVHFDLHSPEYDIYRVERGGEVTYHCPGQIVGYPILNLDRHQRDLHWYLRQLEAVIVNVLAHYGAVGERIDGMTGVWVDGYKVAAIGIKVSRWITMHGFAVNVCPNLSGFERITPCGIADRPVGTLAQFLPMIILSDVKALLVEQFAKVFDLSISHLDLPRDHPPISPGDIKI
ncbi:MAG: lipoyl(octanoyl) transferase LipB [Cyanobacteria bacterium P01_D01_bin.56]